MWQTYLRPASLDEALRLLAEHGGRARLVAGGTDVLVELPRGILPTPTLIDLTAIGALKYVREESGEIRLGALATHNDVLASPVCARQALPLAQACVEVGAPQIRARATVAGNLVTASPANDTITPLMALDARVVLASRAGERVVPLRAFYRGVRKTVLQPNEVLREIRVPLLTHHQRGLFLKLGLRRAQAISVINVAIIATLAGADDHIAEARITLGCVATTIIHAPSAEAYLIGKRLDAATRAEAGRLASQDCAPIDDIRGSGGYRRATIAALVAEGLRRLAMGEERAGWMSAPVLLETVIPAETASLAPFSGAIITRVNGQPYTFTAASGKTLLDLVREDAGLTGTKEGCAEGECGACTVWLDGQAVMSCLVPAAQAHGAAITTIEGLAAAGPPDQSGLHPLQRAFIAHGAVQCGYCIPGMLMASAKLLEEHPHPDLAEVQVALSGNICRCTGYRKILDAVLAASHQPEIAP
ncbi:MAG: FAD binding domain-containing protein [Ktedonobacterales bacterium]|nr:FAD binding domain-containing protein [Ktedonobacterales bacterium]